MKKGATEVIKEINSTPVGKHGKLSVEGTKIVDKNKQEYITKEIQKRKRLINKLIKTKENT